MEFCSASIHSKMSKIEKSLLELNSEILIGVKFLLCLKEDAAEIVRNLNSITAPATYLKEFMNVNSFILKYLSFLSEINCKFEMLNISEKQFKSSISKEKAVISVEPSDFISDSNKHTEDFMDKIVSEKLTVDEPPAQSDTNSNNVTLLEGKRPKKKKAKKEIKLQCKSTNNSDLKSLATTTINNNNSNDSSDTADDTGYNNDYISHIPVTEEKWTVDSKSEFTDISEKKLDIKDNSNCTQLPEALEEVENESKNEVIANKYVKQKASAEVSCSASVDFDAEKILCNGIHLSGEIPMAEVMPTRIGTSNSEVFQDLNCAIDCSKRGDSKLEEHGDEEDCIKPQNLTRILGKEYDVNIEYIKSPSEFYVSITGQQSNFFLELEKMLKLIPLNKNKVGNRNLKNKKAVLRKEIGTYALFYSKCDEVWCRVKITNWCLNVIGDFVNIFLLDSGETKCVSVDDLCPMPECFKEYPALVHRCHLQGIIPIDMDKSDITLSWEKASTEKMKSLTENSNSVRIRIAADDQFHPPISLPVTLWLVDEDNQCVNELLVRSKYARWHSQEVVVKTEIKDSCAVENEELKNWNPMKEDFDSYLNSYDLDMSDPAAGIYGYVGKDYDRICKHFAKTGFCFKGIACKKEHEKLDPLGFTTDREEVYRNAFNILPTPQPKSVLNVQVTCLLKFNQFFCIPENKSLPSSECEDLQSLMRCMNAAKNVRDMKKLLVPPSAGQIVIARYSEDRYWYRGRILESQPEKDLYTVAFVDYGNKEVMPLFDIRAIEPRYLHLPFQAMQCFIFGVDRNPKTSSKDAMDYMSSIINKGHISIEVIVSLPGEYINLLVNVFDQNGRNIGKDLIEKQYAIIKKEMIISNESKSVPG